MVPDKRMRQDVRNQKNHRIAEEMNDEWIATGAILELIDAANACDPNSKLKEVMNIPRNYSTATDVACLERVSPDASEVCELPPEAAYPALGGARNAIPKPGRLPEVAYRFVWIHAERVAELMNEVGYDRRPLTGKDVDSEARHQDRPGGANAGGRHLPGVS